MACDLAVVIRQQSEIQFMRVLKQPMGLDGIEVKHPGHSSSDTTRLRGFVEAFGLVATFLRGVGRVR